MQIFSWRDPKNYCYSPASLSHLELKTVTVTKATLTTNPERCWPDKTCKLRVRLSCQRISTSQGKSIPPSKVTAQRPMAAHICWLFANCMAVITALQYLLQRSREMQTRRCTGFTGKYTKTLFFVHCLFSLLLSLAPSFHCSLSS